MIKRIEENGTIFLEIQKDMIFTTMRFYRDSFTLENINPNTTVYIDMSYVCFVDATGVSCLIDWVSQIKNNQATVTFIGVSNPVAKILEICELDSLIDSNFYSKNYQHDLSCVTSGVHLY